MTSPEGGGGGSTKLMTNGETGGRGSTLLVTSPHQIKMQDFNEFPILIVHTHVYQISDFRYHSLNKILLQEYLCHYE